ncbi:hypothetical protein [Butyrivibrio sp. X503]|uniref:hypothetical protein n=1 Tax=Butyrivibrio sp. X503 TaxID=2364878 RepID=UPI0011C22CE1|nr:hypothetical protein [Butyrivibrio sp. X503]
MLIILVLNAIGCAKKDDKLEAYKNEMTQFYDKLASLGDSIDAIDADSEGSKEELLGYLDEMNDAYQQMGQLEVPEAFSGISDITVEAAEYMQKANECYHLAYDGDFDEDNEQLASQYYERANNRAVVILQVLHGEVPSGEGVSVETEDAYQLSTIDSDISTE